MISTSARLLSAQRVLSKTESDLYPHGDGGAVQPVQKQGDGGSFLQKAGGKSGHVDIFDDADVAVPVISQQLAVGLVTVCSVCGAGQGEEINRNRF